MARDPLIQHPLKTALIWDDALATYGFGRGHPLDPRRLALTVSLLRRTGLVDDVPVIAPAPADAEQLATVHDRDYIAAVGRFSQPGARGDGRRWGLGTEDNPVVPGMHEMARVAAGATLAAAREVMSGRAVRAFSPAGGLHHAHRAKAAGFCVYNDLAVAIEWMKREHGARVMYIDFDAHHGDGVQEIFWEDPDVLSFSIHESGFYLFPGTGYVDEIGGGDGYGTSVNMPLDAQTEDASFRHAFVQLVPELAAAFRPDVIVLQTGCDAHVLDPLTHLRCTTGLFEQLTRTVCDVADEHCGGRVVATGGGGYAIRSVVPRAWTLVWSALSGRDVANQIPGDWLDTVRAEAGDENIPDTLRDAPDAFPPVPLERRAEIEANNLRTLDAVRRQVLPHLTGWSLGF